MSIVFVILRHISKDEHKTLWRESYSSIRNFYPHVSIIIIDDKSSINDDFNVINTTFIKSESGAGEVLPYYYFNKYKWADKMIFLHDSMKLSRPFTEDELSCEIKFHWYFLNHIWDDDNKINDLLNKFPLPYCNDLINWNKNKNDWWGCFGGASIISLNIVEEVEKKYSMFSILSENMKTREQRMAFERIFGIIMFKEKYIFKYNCNTCGDLEVYHDGYHRLSNKEDLKKWYNGAIFKSWHGR